MILAVVVEVVCLWRMLLVRQRPSHPNQQTTLTMLQRVIRPSRGKPGEEGPEVLRVQPPLELPLELPLEQPRDQRSQRANRPIHWMQLKRGWLNHPSRQRLTLAQRTRWSPSQRRLEEKWMWCRQACHPC